MSGTAQSSEVVPLVPSTLPTIQRPSRDQSVGCTMIELLNSSCGSVAPLTDFSYTPDAT